jgi:hypothetical protein
LTRHCHFGSAETILIVALTLRCSPQLKGLVEQSVRITNLTNEKASLFIDGQPVGVFSKTEWTNGVDLSPLPTPMNRQAMEVEKLVRLRNRLHFTCWRQLAAPLANGSASDVSKATEGLSRIEQQLVALQRTAAKPTPKWFELISP